MNSTMSRFVLEARKRSGEPYPGKSLYLICCGLLRHLRDYESQINFIDEKDFAFSSFSKVLDSKMKEVLTRGIGAEIKQSRLFCHKMRQQFGTMVCLDSILQNLFNTQ